MNIVRIFKGYALSELHEQIAAFGTDRKLSPIHTAIAVDRDHNAVSYLITVVYEPVKLQGFAHGGYVGQSRCDSSEPVGIAHDTEQPIQKVEAGRLPRWLCPKCYGEYIMTDDGKRCPNCNPYKPPSEV